MIRDKQISEKEAPAATHEAGAAGASAHVIKVSAPPLLGMLTHREVSIKKELCADGEAGEGAGSVLV